MPAFPPAGAPPTPPVGNVACNEREGVPSVSSLKTTTLLVLLPFVLVSTSTLRSCSSATAAADEKRVTANTLLAPSHARRGLLKSIVISGVRQQTRHRPLPFRSPGPKSYATPLRLDQLRPSHLRLSISAPSRCHP